MKKVWIIRVITVLYLAAVAFLCFANFSKMPDVPRTFFGIPADKLVHFAMFLPFPVLAFFSLWPKRPGVLNTLLAIVLLFALGCLMAWGTEYYQGMLPYRTMDPADFNADRIGLICGSIITFIVQLFAHKKTDAKTSH